ncbi:aminoglycoside phosphotransferase family protein [Yoonia sp. SS1-5]|uniref:Aminoglycoside phosphotransferase family protein n=1 Tax=Yoonia rhodophyticola TaxID=3137370 RepID=A0AAN0M9N2_9RHOB
MSANGAATTDQPARNTLSHAGQLIGVLCDADLIDRADLLSASVEITDISRRNRNYFVHVGGQRRYVVKCADGQTGLGTVTHEARAYNWLSDTTDYPGFPVTPRRYLWAADSGMLVLEAVDPAISAGVIARSDQGLSLSRARMIGRSLASLHDCPVVEGSLPVLPRDWFLSVHLPSLAAAENMSFAALGLTRQIQQHKPFCDALDALSDQWCADAPINSDVKWDNILFRQHASGPGGRQPVFLDWEFLGHGDRAWDIGSIIAEYLYAWTHTGLHKLSDPAGIDAAMNYALEAHLDEVGAFWTGYVGRADLPANRAATLLQKAIQFAAGRLVLKCFEAMQEQSGKADGTGPTLQLAANLLARPVEAAVHLLALPIAPDRRAA